MSSPKEEAINLITRLLDEASWDDIMYELYVKKKIELGIRAADDGRVIPHEEVKRMFSVERSFFDRPLPTGLSDEAYRADAKSG